MVREKQSRSPLLLAALGLTCWLASAISQASLRGGVSDGGGSAVVCRDQNQNIKSAELLDLWEARVLLGRKVVVPTDPSLNEFQIAAMIAKNIDLGGAGVELTALGGLVQLPHRGGRWENYTKFLEQTVPSNFVSKGVQTFPSIVRYLPGGTVLKPVQDYKSPVLPKDCQIEQLAVFQDQYNRLLVMEEIWQKLDRENRAALIVHESLYESLRTNRREQTSDLTRLTVGLAFTGLAFEWVYDGLPQTVTLCGGSSFGGHVDGLRFAIYDPNGLGIDATIQLFNVRGNGVMTKEQISWPFAISPLADPTSIISEKSHSQRLSTPMYGNEMLTMTIGPSYDGKNLVIYAGLKGDTQHEMLCQKSQVPKWTRVF